MNTKSEWQAVHHQMMADDRRKLGDPPTADELIAYSRGELSPQQEERVRALLVAYPELARTLAEPFPMEGAEPGDPDYLSDEEFAAHRASLQKRMLRPPDGRLLRFWRVASAIAAAIALVFGGLLWRARSELVEPRLVGGTVVLRDANRGEPEEPREVMTKTDSVVLVAGVGNNTGFRHYRLVIVGAGPEPVWRSEAMTRPEDGRFSVTVTRKLLRPGRYQLRILGVEGARETPLTSYPFRVPER